MPELPDVQVHKEYLDATSLHQRVENVYVSARDTLRDVSAATVRRRLRGRSLESTRRHGKHLFARIGDDGWLRLHFGMTGRPAYYRTGPREGPDPEHTRLRLDFEGGGHLAYINVRRLGEIGLVDDPVRFVREEGLGPDALDPDLDADALAGVLEGRRGALKPTLMNQGHVAGIGSVYADEMLFQAGLHPETPAGDLNREEVEELHRQMRRVLRAAVDARVEDFPDWFLLPHRDTDMKCPECGGELERIEVSGRATYLCPRKQGRGP